MYFSGLWINWSKNSEMIMLQRKRNSNICSLLVVIITVVCGPILIGVAYKYSEVGLLNSFVALVAVVGAPIVASI